ncbi:hypothetical protein F1559_004625 [Cyanidiococcus yangmingshanensis]|uniref:Uncharacterized protein n=1 Tax=Cyanidiococcus yangmingshanensis TaxID=2690220 RepID=A0A7J7IK19_9RHOD|nr:hypothetical protein F1559_004625 [Cyanidiococcus yangmingshanensis]
MSRKRHHRPCSVATSSLKPVRRCRMRKRQVRGTSDGILTLDAIFGGQSRESAKNAPSSRQVPQPCCPRVQSKSSTTSRAFCTSGKSVDASTAAMSASSDRSADSETCSRDEDYLDVPQNKQYARRGPQQGVEVANTSGAGRGALPNIRDRREGAFTSMAPDTDAITRSSSHRDAAASLRTIRNESCEPAAGSSRGASGEPIAVVSKESRRALSLCSNALRDKQIQRARRAKLSRAEHRDDHRCAPTETFQTLSASSEYTGMNDDSGLASIQRGDALRQDSRSLVFRVYTASKSSASSSSSSSITEHRVSGLGEGTHERPRCDETSCTSSDKSASGRQALFAIDAAANAVNRANLDRGSFLDHGACPDSKMIPNKPPSSSDHTHERMDSASGSCSIEKGACMRHQDTVMASRGPECGMLATCTRIGVVDCQHGARSRAADACRASRSEMSTNWSQEGMSCLYESEQGSCQRPDRTKCSMETNPPNEREIMQTTSAPAVVAGVVGEISCRASVASAVAGQHVSPDIGEDTANQCMAVVDHRPFRVVFHGHHGRAIEALFRSRASSAACCGQGPSNRFVYPFGVGFCNPATGACIVCGLGDIVRGLRDDAHAWTPDDLASLYLATHLSGHFWLTQQETHSFRLRESLEKHWGSGSLPSLSFGCMHVPQDRCAICGSETMRTLLSAFAHLLATLAASSRSCESMSVGQVLDPYWILLGRSLDAEAWPDATLLAFVDGLFEICLFGREEASLWRPRFAKLVTIALERVSSESAFQDWCRGVLDAPRWQRCLMPGWHASAITLIRAIPPKGRCRVLQRCLCVILLKRESLVESSQPHDTRSPTGGHGATSAQDPLSSTALIERVTQTLLAEISVRDASDESRMDLDRLDRTAQCLRMLLLDWSLSSNAAKVASKLDQARAQRLLEVIAYWMRMTRSMTEPKSYRVRTQLHLLRQQLREWRVDGAASGILA